MSAILLVEDDATIAMGVAYSLKQDGFQVSLADRLEEARDLLKSSPFDPVLLDLGLLDGSGYELRKEIRAAGDTPIIILSARDEEARIVLGLGPGHARLPHQTQFGIRSHVSHVFRIPV